LADVIADRAVTARGPAAAARVAAEDRGAIGRVVLADLAVPVARVVVNGAARADLAVRAASVVAAALVVRAASAASGSSAVKSARSRWNCRR
jgi:hypothetical protein